MADFTLDTSGHVDRLYNRTAWYGWPDLDAFTQGYVEAAFHSAFGGDLQPDGTWKMRVGFSDLAPEALAAILKDCSLIQNLAGGKDKTAREGRLFWIGRNTAAATGAVGAAFPPLTAHLGDDGRVYLREVKP